MNKNYLKYFVGFFLTIGLIIILIILLFGGGGTKKKEAPKTSKALSSLASTDAQVKMTIAGRVRSTQEYVEIQITSSRNTNNFSIINGYEGKVVDNKKFDNNQAAYETFLRALALAGYTRGDSSKALADDRGYCPLGQRYIFEVIENGKTTQRYWTTSCGKSTPKTYLGSASLTTTLFENQIPDYETKVNSIEY